MRSVTHQMPATAGREKACQGEALSSCSSDETGLPRQVPEDAGQGLLERAFARENMLRAWKRVRANKGAAGIDGLDIAQTAEHLRWAWPDIRQQLLASRYYPQPVRRVAIPKPDGSERELGIPTVTDRLIQQALLQVLQPLIDPTFSEHSYGFRPGRRAHDAVLAAQSFALVLRILAAVMLILMALYIANWWKGLLRIEALGRVLWRRIEPIGRRLMPVVKVPQAFALGSLWGWMPCGLIYSMLAWSLAVAEPLRAAAMMGAFGLGTLPAVLATGVAARRVSIWIRSPATRTLAALLIITFAVW